MVSVWRMGEGEEPLMAILDKTGYPVRWDGDDLLVLEGEGQDTDYVGGLFDMDLQDKMVCYGGTVDKDFHLKVWKQT